MKTISYGSKKPWPPLKPTNFNIIPKMYDSDEDAVEGNYSSGFAHCKQQDNLLLSWLLASLSEPIRVWMVAYSPTKFGRRSRSSSPLKLEWMLDNSSTTEEHKEICKHEFLFAWNQEVCALKNILKLSWMVYQVNTTLWLHLLSCDWILTPLKRWKPYCLQLKHVLRSAIKMKSWSQIPQFRRKLLRLSHGNKEILILDFVEEAPVVTMEEEDLVKVVANLNSTSLNVSFVASLATLCGIAIIDLIDTIIIQINNSKLNFLHHMLSINLGIHHNHRLIFPQTPTPLLNLCLKL